MSSIILNIYYKPKPVVINLIFFYFIKFIKIKIIYNSTAIYNLQNYNLNVLYYRSNNALLIVNL